jgi:hypothetical protein
VPEIMILCQKNFSGLELTLVKGQQKAWKWYAQNKDEEIKKF